MLEQVNGKPLVGSSARAFFATMGRIEPGDTLSLVVKRAGKPIALVLVAE